MSDHSIVLPAVEIVVDTGISDSLLERGGSVGSAELSSPTSQSETASVSSEDVDLDRTLTHKISLINILEISSSQLVSDVDLDTEQEDTMSQTVPSYSSKYRKSGRTQNIEEAIKQVSDEVTILYTNIVQYMPDIMHCTGQALSS